MRCIRLILVLIKDLREPTKKNLALELKLHKGKETKEEAEERYQAEKAKKTNADDQVYALLTFKEALSTGLVSTCYFPNVYSVLQLIWRIAFQILL